MANLHQLLKAMIEKGGSDLHITTSSPPQLRIDGKLHPLKMPPLSPPETKQLCYSILTDAQKHRFEEDMHCPGCAARARGVLRQEVPAAINLEVGVQLRANDGAILAGGEHNQVAACSQGGRGELPFGQIPFVIRQVPSPKVDV